MFDIIFTETCTLLSRLVKQNLWMVQGVLAAEGISLEFRHIASYLLWYSQCHSQTTLLNQVRREIESFSVSAHLSSDMALLICALLEMANIIEISLNKMEKSSVHLF